MTKPSLKTTDRPPEHYREGVTKWSDLVGDLSTGFRDYRAEMGRRALRAATIDKRLSVLARCELAIGHPLTQATTEELRDWLDQHKLNAKSRYAYISHLVSFYKWALAEERTTRDPTLRLTKPKLRRSLPRPISNDDLRILVDWAPTTEIRAMIVLAGHCGLRCMEIAQLDVSDIMTENKPAVIHVTHGKGDRPRVVPMPSAVTAALISHGLGAYGPVFHDQFGDPYPAWKVSHMIREHIHGCGITASAHQLRHAFATEVYRQSNDLRLTQELMGHSSPATTAGYAAWNPERAAEVVARLFT